MLSIVQEAPWLLQIWIEYSKYQSVELVAIPSKSVEAVAVLCSV